MKKCVIFIIFFSLFLTGNILVFANQPDNVYKNGLFSVTLPEKLKGTYEVKKEKDKISIFHKA